MFIFTHDKNRLHEHFRRDPVKFAYHMGDLDDLFFDRCQWAASYYKSTRIDECLLIYNSDSGSTVHAMGMSERLVPLVEETIDVLPDSFSVHIEQDCRQIIRKAYDEIESLSVLRMELEAIKEHEIARPDRIIRLDQSHDPALKALYDRAYPEHWYEKRILNVGKYLGWKEDGSIVAAAGVHVYAPEYKIAVLGNIATHPDYRGRGIASDLTLKLVRGLADEGLSICLNVNKNNEAARRCYERIGFATAFEYLGGRYRRKPFA